MNYLDAMNWFNPMLGPDGAGGGDPPDDTKKDEPEKDEPKDDKKEKKYSDEDVDAIIDKKFAKWQKKHEEELAAKTTEAEKLATMNADDKTKYEQEQLKAKVAEYERREAKAALAKEAKSNLNEKGISVDEDLLMMIVSDDADATKKAVDSFAAAFTDAVDTAVKEALKGKTPKTGSGASTLTKDEIMKIKDPVERKKAIAENLKLFE